MTGFGAKQTEIELILQKSSLVCCDHETVHYGLEKQTSVPI